ncbi:hypothetical protein [Actinoplanes sp. NBRC 101535]|uniref:hypothetical protein n=1 Tax=Actinoplanes sp. NBRC 101535 TaxID=3032196 RepID=UPI0025569A0B|nr:hypothetical protein [Actinoplanes sp. NBRC 101535]
MDVRLWSVVAEPVALAAAGVGAAARQGGRAVFGVGADALVVIVDGGFRTADEVSVSGPFPRQVEKLLIGDGGRVPVVAFARLPEGCLALGGARVVRMGHRRGVLHDLGLYLDAPLTYDLLDRVRPTAPPPAQPDVDWVELLPGEPEAALQQFVAGWYGDLPAAATPAGDGPEPLRAFYRAAAGRPEVYGVSTRIWPEPISSPELPEGTLGFGQEGDGVFTLLMEEGARNPPVYYHGLSDRPLRERERLAGYLLLSALSHAAMDSSPGGMAFVDKAQVKRIVAPLRKVPMKPMRWPSARSRFYVGPGIVVLVGDDDADWYEVYVGARHRSLLRRLRKLGLDWEVFDG